jgi:uncharacterized damage-inducible protein DinB
MEMREHLRRMYAYDAWANRAALASIGRSAAPPPAALRRMGHVLGAQYLWLGRLRREREPGPVWPEWSLEECDRRTGEIARRWSAYLGRIRPGSLDRAVAYVSSAGEPWTSGVGDILTHVVLHSAYHRGQIATDLRGSGADPASTDFIHCVRQGYLE